MDTALIITWKVPFPGREKTALEFAVESEEVWGKQAAEGHCSKPEWFFLPEGTGMWMVIGERRVLQDLITTEEIRRLLMKGLFLLDGWRYGFADTGTGAEKFMGDYSSVVTALAAV